MGGRSIVISFDVAHGIAGSGNLSARVGTSNETTRFFVNGVSMKFTPTCEKG